MTVDGTRVNKALRLYAELIYDHVQVEIFVKYSFRK